MENNVDVNKNYDVGETYSSPSKTFEDARYEEAI